MKRFLTVGLILVCFGVLFSAIGAGDFSADAKKGFGWYFEQDYTANFSVYEAKLKTMMENQGIEWNKRRIEATTDRRNKIEQIREALRGATDAQVNAVLSALGL